MKTALLGLLICLAVFGLGVAQQRGGELIEAIITDREPDSLDPMYSNGQSFAFDVWALMGGTPIQRHPQTGELVPGYIERWELSEDGRRAELTLKAGITFDSGEVLDAEALAYAWNRGLEDSWVLADLEAIEVVDALTIALIFPEPNPGVFDELAAAWWLYPVSPADLERMGELEYGRRPSSFGPWMVETWREGRSVSLVHNPRYSGWAPDFYENRGQPHLDRITYLLIPEEATALAAFEAGEIHVLRVSSRDAERLRGNPNVQIFESLDTRLSENVLFSAQPPSLTQELAVRQAVSHAIDRAFIIEVVLNGDGIESYGPLHPQAPLYLAASAELAARYDPERARQILDEAGWELGGDGIRSRDGRRLQLALSTKSMLSRTQIAQIMQSQLRAVGIELTISIEEDALQDEKLAAGNFDLMLQRVGGGLTEPRELWYAYHSASLYRNTFFEDAALDAQLEALIAAASFEERQRIAAEVQEFVIREALFLPLYIRQDFIAVASSVQNYLLSPFFIEPQLHMYLDVYMQR
jgi:peptide/nickel transport system substrate-binding protein